MKTERNPQGGVFAQCVAYIKDEVKSGRVWVESINSLDGTALVRFDCGDRPRSVCHKVSLLALEFGPVGWDGWRSI